MRKTIPFLTLLLLAGCSKKVGILSNNDSPIIISDTTTVPTAKDNEGPQTTAEHDKVFGNAKNKYTAHDKSAGDKDDYRPGCLVFPASTVPIPTSAQSFKVTYTASDNSTGILVTWAEQGDADGDAGDITMGPGFSAPPPPPPPGPVKKITKGMKVTSMDWSIDGGSATTVTANGVIVRYCPNRGQCKDDNEKDLCTKKP